MIYTYMCEECGHEEDFEYPMDVERPERKLCSFCDTMTMHRVFTGALHIPFQWTGKDSYKFDKRPRHNRKYR